MESNFFKFLPLKHKLISSDDYLTYVEAPKIYWNGKEVTKVTGGFFTAGIKYTFVKPDGENIEITEVQACEDNARREKAVLEELRPQIETADSETLRDLYSDCRKGGYYEIALTILNIASEKFPEDLNNFLRRSKFSFENPGEPLREKKMRWNLNMMNYSQESWINI